ncbi:MAG: RNA-binding protein [Chitinophagaceae bacterium]|nr:RNA-binding protein [Anaerolineae bacterium]
MTKKLYVGNLSYDSTEDKIRQLFSSAGDIASATIIIDRETGRSKGFGFVEMETEEGAQEAIKQFNGYQLEGRALTVNEARPREDRPGMGGGGDRGSRGDDRGPRRDDRRNTRY